jgi:mRNA interferase MazF
VYSAYHGLLSQVAVGIEEGLRYESAIHCDELVSLPKSALTDYVGNLSAAKIAALNRALFVALGLSPGESAG